MSSIKSLTVIGGGAAGFFCAVNAARMNPLLKVVIVEKSNKLLSKVKISGGGRCNVTHACDDITEMSRCYPRGGNFVKKSFHQFFVTDTVQWFAERGAELKTEKDGRMFPVTDSSQTIIDCLMREANKFGVDILMNAEVSSLSALGKKYRVQLKNGRQIESDFVCIACGGYSKAPMFEWIKNLGHTIEEPAPSLFTFNLPGHPITVLQGISINHAAVKLAGTKLEQSGPMLITHWGLSGPAVLKLSAWLARELASQNYEFKIFINWLPLYTEQTLKETFTAFRNYLASQRIQSKNSFGLPARLWDFLTEQAGVTGDMRWADLPSSIQNKLIRSLTALECQVKGKTTFKEEFVTAGGVSLNEVDHNTMMSKKNKGVFFAGEILNVDGITGGYNFQHAWTSGWIAAKAIAESAG